MTCPFCGSSRIEHPETIEVGATRRCIDCDAKCVYQVHENRVSPITKMSNTIYIWRWINPRPAPPPSNPKKKPRRRRKQE